MKITELKYYAKWIGTRNQLIIKVEVGDSLYGLGEAGFSGRELAVQGAIKHLREFLIGKDPRCISALWQEMYRGAYFEGGRTITAAISAIDIALYDILGKSLKTPVYQLLGGKFREKIPCFASSIAQGAAPLIKEIKVLLEEGWKIIRIMPQSTELDSTYLTSNKASLFDPASSISLTAGVIRAIRDKLGYDFQLGIDFHHRLSIAETISFCNRLQAADLDFLEEPIRDQNPAAYKVLRDKIKIPLAIGEEMSNKWDYRPYIEEGLTQFIRTDICNIGGFTEAMKVAALAETYYIDHMLHNPLGAICTAASVHFAAAVPLFHSLEYRSLNSDMPSVAGSGYFSNELFAENAFIQVPNKAGLGIELNGTAIDSAEEFKFWEPRRLQKPDGSYTNW